MNGESKDAKPLTAAVLRTRKTAVTAHGELLQAFAAGILEASTAALQGFNTASIKVSRAGESGVALKSLELPPLRETLLANGQRLTVFIECDRQFEILISDLCLGGAGFAPNEDELTRPQTKLERRLRDHVLTCILRELSSALSKELLRECAVIDEDINPAEQRANTQSEFIRFSFLVNVFSTAAEFTLLAPQDQLNSFLGVSHAPQGGEGKTAHDALLPCVMTLDVCLPPALARADELMRLKVGKVLQLNIPARSPVHLHLGDCEVASGRLRASETRMEIIISPQGAELHPEVSA